jgi:hypothetical protein
MILERKHAIRVQIFHAKQKRGREWCATARSAPDRVQSGADSAGSTNADPRPHVDQEHLDGWGES